MHKLKATGSWFDPSVQNPLLTNRKQPFQIRLVKPQPIDHPGGIAECHFNNRPSAPDPAKALGEHATSNGGQLPGR
jgi:hypothetical protein